MAWDCPVSCLCKGPVVKCCEPQQVLFLPVKGHPNVTELLLDSCRLFVLNSDTLQNFSSLEKLSVKRTNLSSLDTDAFHYLPSLRSLILEDVNLSNTAIHHNTFAGLQITSLSLRNNHLDRIERHTFAGLVNVEHLDLSMNKIVSIEEKSFTTLKSLQVLNLENNSLSTITPLWFSGVSLNGTGMQISLRGNNLICECKYRGIDLPEYAWFKRCLFRYIQQHMHSDFTFNQFVDTPNILTLPENPQPISDSEERPSQVMHWSRDNSEDTPPQLSRQSNGSSQQLQHRAQEPAQI
ncbi:reticulon-4 receptor-like 2 [Amia ocellicauda]|uniref:reticulon-4 receptor-like 2 n=1 Tax=Amia ocellicauda TaxID=2972642 RepID=UPI0034648AB2